MKYLKQFVIGSSWLVSLSFLYAAAFHRPNKNYTYENYSLVAPVWFGLWNIISLIMAEHFGLTMRMRFLIVSVISCLCIMTIVTKFKSYDFTEKELNEYYVYIFIKYMITWNIIIYYTEKYF